MRVDRAAVRARLASSMAAMLAQGVLVEDILEAMRLSVRQMSAQAQANPMPARRTELLSFYSDADQILGDACRRIDIAGKSAKKIAGVR
jgi:hypothetical protein